MQNNLLEKIQNLVNKVKEKSLLQNKIEILKQYISDYQVCKFLEYCYSPYKNYQVNSNDLKKHSDLVELVFFNDIFQLCDNLNNKVLTGNKAISAINSFINQNIQYENLLYDFFDRNLKLNLTISQLNKIFHNIIPNFTTPKLIKYEPQLKDLYHLDRYCIERKLEGVHVLTFIKYNNNNPIITCVSTSNKEFKTLDKVKEELLTLYKLSLFNGRDIVIDGNMCIIEEDDFENWFSIQTEINMKNHTIMHPKYYCYDILLLEEFQGLKHSMNYDIRYRNLKQFISLENKKLKTLTFLFAAPYTDANLKLLVDTYIMTEKWSGLVFRKLAPFTTDENKDFLEYNFFKKDTAIVLNIEKTIDKDNNPCLKDIIIEYNHMPIHICEGITENQKKVWYQNPELIIGKTILFKCLLEDKQIKNPKLVTVYDKKQIEK